MTDLRELKSAFEERVRRLETELEGRDRQLSTLAEVASRIHGAEDVPTILDMTLETILRRMELRAGWVFMGDERERTLRLAASRGVSEAYLEEVRQEGLGECLCPEVFWTGHRMQARNTTQCPRMPSIVGGLAAPVAHACIPLRFEGRSKGVLNLAARPDEQFSDGELRFLETLAHHVCIAVERAEHRAAERRRDREARALAAITKAVGGSLDAAAVLRAVGATAAEILGSDQIYILLGSDPRKVKVGYVSGGARAEIQEGQTLDLVAMGWSLSVQALEGRQALKVDDRDTDGRINRREARRLGVASALVTPLIAHEHVLGAMVLARKATRRWTEEETDVAEALAAQASVALENARLYEEARRAYDEARGAFQDLKAAQQRIVQTEKMAVLGTFASGLAHEVRNPLNSIALQLSLLERRTSRLEGDLSGELEELIGVIREEIKRLDALVGDFLMFSRTNRIQHQTASLEALVDEVARLVRPEAREAGVTLRRQRLGEPTPSLPMDVEKMKQVLLNLVRNAIEAMPGGGVVTVESGAVDGQARVVVRDNGPGLPEGLDIFQLFVTTKARGTGLGLSIAQQIVMEHGGEITAASEPGRGATFTVSLPLPAAGSPAPQGEVDER